MRAYRASNHAACTQDVTESGSCSLLSVRVCVCKLYVRWFPDACIRISTDAGRWALCVLFCYLLASLIDLSDAPISFLSGAGMPASIARSIM